MAEAMRETREAIWQEELQQLLRQDKRKAEDIAQDPKSAEWKVAIAADLKMRTTATNRWIGVALNMGGLHSVSRQISARQKNHPPV